MNRPRPILAQIAVLTQAPAQRHNLLLDSRWRAVPTTWTTRSPIGEIHPIQATISSAPHPKRHRAHANPKLIGYRAHALARMHRTYHCPARLLNTEFLAMVNPSKKPKPYINCSTIAETQLFNDR
jgi:hypothetical protein